MTGPVLVAVVVNTVAGSAGVGFAVLSLARPSVLSRGDGSPSPGERFYARMYAARGVPFGLLVAVLPWLGGAAVPAVPACLVAAAVAQIADAAIGASRREWGMVAGGGLAAVVHATTAALVATTPGGP